jgi:hypothetical protein
MSKTSVPQNATTPDALHFPALALEDAAFSRKPEGSFRFVRAKFHTPDRYRH